MKLGEKNSFLDIERVSADLTGKGRTLIKVKINIYDQRADVTMQSVYEWYIQKAEQIGTNLQ
jgi:hypothetical protein